MAPAARLLGPLEAVASQSFGLRYVCSTCRRQCLPPPGRVVVHHSRRHNSNISLTEKVRRKLWGTDKPPGLKDPYGESAFERARRGAPEEGQEPEQELIEQEATPPPAYEPQTTWKGLTRVGHLGRWWELPASQNDKFTPFLHEKVESPEQLADVLQSAFVELHKERHGWEGSQGMDFLGFDLEKDLDFKFNYLKAVSQRTGYRIPDHHLATITTPSRLLAILTNLAKPKPKKVADILAADTELTSLPNVKIYNKRRTPMHEEIEIGRFKVIEEVLKARGLPDRFKGVKEELETRGLLTNDSAR